MQVMTSFKYTLMLIGDIKRYISYDIYVHRNIYYTAPTCYTRHVNLKVPLMCQKYRIEYFACGTYKKKNRRKQNNLCKFWWESTWYSIHNMYIVHQIYLSLTQLIYKTKIVLLKLLYLSFIVIMAHQNNTFQLYCSSTSIINNNIFNDNNIIYLINFFFHFRTIYYFKLFYLTKITIKT